ncbi:MAG: hypothetical protein ACYC46_14395 [Acidobacteriaceae bacterium]
MMTELHPANHPKRESDGTLPLLYTGGGVFGFGLVCALLVLVFGSVDIHGPHNNSGWLALVFAIGCLPLGAMLLLLGGAKWFGGRKR